MAIELIWWFTSSLRKVLKIIRLIHNSLVPAFCYAHESVPLFHWKSMQPNNISRRDFVSKSLAVASPAMLAANALPLVAAESEPGAARKLKVVCVGGHPDDPESGCAGTLTRYAQLGHSVTVIYLTRGERGIRDKGLDDPARIRSAESETACKIIGAKAMFFGQIDGATEITRAHVEAMTK